MANTKSNFSILVDVEFDTKQIQQKLNQQAKIPKINVDTMSVKNATIDVAKLGQTMSDTALTFNAANEIFSTSIDIITSMLDQVYELDAALVEFQKVSDLGGESLDRYVDSLAELGNTVGRTASEMISAATEFRKNSFNDEDSATLALVASTFQNVADESITAGEAASFLIAQMTAFNIEAENSEHIIDAVNEVSNRFSVSSGDLANNLGIASAALAVGGNEFEEVLALMTAGTEVTRAANRTARGLVSVQSRLNQVVDESSSTGKALTEWYNEHNIAIYDQQGQLLSLYDVLSQVAQIWPTLTKNEQAYYLNQQAGANQTQNLAAILSNFQTAIDATATAYNSTGSAARESQRAMEGLEAILIIGLTGHICWKPLRASTTKV